MKRLSFFLLPLVLVGGESHSRVLVYQERIRGIRASPIFLDGVEVASLRQRWSYFVLEIPPGEHTIVDRHKSNGMVLQIEPGKDYYLRLDDSLTLAGMKLTRISCQEARIAIESGRLHPIQPGDVRDDSKVSLKMPAPACELQSGADKPQ